MTTERQRDRETARSLAVQVRRTCLVSIAVLTVWASATAQQIYRVDAAAAGGDGSDWNLAFNDLQDALDVASNLDQIWVKQGIYVPSTSPTPTVPRSFTFAIPEGVELYGGFAGGEAFLSDRPTNLFASTVLSGDISMTPAIADDVYSVVTILGAEDLVIIDGFLIRNGNASSIGPSPEQLGGGLYAEDSNVRVENCSFVLNRAIRGGGMYFNNTDAEIEDYGLELVSCTFRGNFANEAGGGLATYQAGVSTEVPVSHIFNCLFEANIAGSINWFVGHEGGGGLYVENREVRLTGGPIFYIYNSIFTNNSARSGSGGGIFLRGDEPLSTENADRVHIQNCTITGNSSRAIGQISGDGTPRAGGAGIFVEEGYDSSRIDNCIFWDNQGSVNPSDLTGPGTRIGGATVALAIKVTYSDLIFQLGSGSTGGGGTFPTAHPGAGNIAADPLFVNPANLNFGLQSTSPCLDAGNSNDIALDYPDFALNGPTLDPTPIDFLGNLRDVDFPGASSGVSAPTTPAGVIVDMGAIEQPDLP